MKMMKESGKENTVVKSPHTCGVTCLGPLTFHSEAVGEKVTLSQGCQVAERAATTFKNGIVFSSRPVRVQERIRLRVDKDLHKWHGAVRVGFTNVSPSGRPLPLPRLAIPDLTDTPGHWAAPVHETICLAGSELEFWVSSSGSIYVSSKNIKAHKLLPGVDLSQPLWAMIDVYGQTCRVALLGSEKKTMLFTRQSCPARVCLTSPEVDNHDALIPDSCTEASADDDCVACMEKKASICFPCGHQCLCRPCASRIMHEFGTCPLCRYAVQQRKGI